MARYHFHVRERTDHSDEEGVELPDLSSARTYAACYLADLLKAGPDTPGPGSDWTMQVQSPPGLTLFMLHFASMDAPALAGPRPVIAAG